MAPNPNQFVTVPQGPVPNTPTPTGNFGNPTDLLKGTHPVSSNSSGVPKPLPGSTKGIVYTDGHGKWVFRDTGVEAANGGNYVLYQFLNGSWTQAASQTPTGLPVVGTALSGVEAIGSFFNKLSDPNTWVRAGEFLGGAILLAVGAHAILKSNSAYGSTTRKVAKYVK